MVPIYSIAISPSRTVDGNYFFRTLLILSSAFLSLSLLLGSTLNKLRVSLAHWRQMPNSGPSRPRRAGLQFALGFIPRLPFRLLTGRDRNTTCSLTPSYKGEMYGGYDVFHSSGMVVSMRPQCYKAYGLPPSVAAGRYPGFPPTPLYVNQAYSCTFDPQQVGVSVTLVTLVSLFVFLINPIGPSGIDPGRRPGANPSTAPFFERGLHLNFSRWFYRPRPTLIGKLQVKNTPGDTDGLRPGSSGRNIV